MSGPMYKHSQSSRTYWFLTIRVTQDVLNKFEYFPIKCRIQRAGEAYCRSVENYKKEQQDETMAHDTLKTKAIIYAILPSEARC